MMKSVMRALSLPFIMRRFASLNSPRYELPGAQPKVLAQLDGTFQREPASAPPQAASPVEA
jgi:hypothetical protein